ncbi:hypothetical protein [Streptomyces sp. CC208A]|uniref:hypothetical protein n=1 Tax=Streptomyces sp. CC208A TaxID=3044573 RepID=UPI0024A7C3A0|nr:hypothetical protein [Streptomyces sp. CC208A]
MNTENPGCLTGAARAVALVVVLPVRLVWEALAFCLRQLWRWILAPVGRALGWLLHHLLLVPLRWLWEWLLLPVGKALWWAVDLLLVTPLTWLWRYVLGPVRRFVGAALAWAWRIAGQVSRAVGRMVRRVLWHTIGRPLVWAYRVVLTPVGHWLRAWVWEPLAAAGRAVRAAAREVRAALFGGPR